MKCKIQMWTIQGWADVKESVDGSDYKTALFDSEEEAEEEADLFRDLDHSVRIVPANTEEEFNLY